ncbi:response regulator [Lysobacter sp.]|uniref:response regulator n=1 Tax=Lysobacter sp. TaxID=72226 RepID=UPI002D754D68|nr:response regulator [Lysobacter sp.]HZX78804.1 response regulator [Lysobacter sp.]
MSARTLMGRRLMLVEDDYFIGSTLKDVLELEGATVIGPFPDVASALQGMGDGRGIDVALLDINLDGEMSFPVADALQGLDVPTVLISGYDTHALPAPYADLPHCEKPIDVHQLLRILAGLQGTRAMGAART